MEIKLCVYCKNKIKVKGFKPNKKRILQGILLQEIRRKESYKTLYDMRKHTTKRQIKILFKTMSVSKVTA